MRTLIVDYDFFSAIGGGQTLYRRIVERHPDVEFWYPSRGLDARAAARGELPPNARPFVFDPHTPVGRKLPIRKTSSFDMPYAQALAQICPPIQGMVFDAVDVPSFFPCCHLIRPILAAYGIMVGRIALGLVGWPSESVRNGYEAEGGEAVASRLRSCEVSAIKVSDVLYSVAGLFADADSTLGRPVVDLELPDTLEEFPPPPPRPGGNGLPDLWYVGRLDRNKGPDLFLEIAARVPRDLFGGCFLTGPDNRAWADGPSWSDRLAEQAQALGLDAVYRGQLSDAQLRQDVYRGRTVIVVPSRTDVVNYTALEALSNGCPIILSKNAGAADFLKEHHPEILPPVIDPEDVDAASVALRGVLERFDATAARLRESLLEHPFEKPRIGFMKAVYGAGDARPELPPDLPPPHPLATLPASTWRPAPLPEMPVAALSVVVLVRDCPAQLAATLSSLMRQITPPSDIVVVDDGSRDPRIMRRIVGEYPALTLIRQGRQGRAWAANAGWQVAREALVAFLDAGDILASDFTAGAMSAVSVAADIRGFLPATLRPADIEPAAAGFPIRVQHGGDRAGAGLVACRDALTQIGGFDVTAGPGAQAGLISRIADLGQIVAGQAGTPTLWQPWGDGAPPSYMFEPQGDLQDQRGPVDFDRSPWSGGPAHKVASPALSTKETT